MNTFKETLFEIMKLHLNKWANLPSKLNLYDNPHIMEAHYVNLN